MGNWVLPGLGDVGSYQVSGTPFVFNVTGQNAAAVSATATLKYVTSEVQINTTGAGCTVHFGDANDQTYALPAGLSTFRIKCKKIVVSAVPNQTVSVCASLTGIEAKHMEQHDQNDYGTVA